MSIDIQKWKAEAHENAAKTVANMLQVSSKVPQSCGNLHKLTLYMLLLVFTYHVIKLKNRNYSINKVTNKGHDR